MKKLYLIILFLIAVSCVHSQTLPPTSGTAPRSNSSVIPEDYNISARSIMLLPRFDDTAQANTYTKPSFDTCARVFYNRATNSIWYRACNPKRWLPLGGGGSDIDVFLIAGQSNAVGNSGSPDSAIVPTSGTAYQFYNNAITAAVEPIGNSDGSAWGSFAQTYYALTGRKICFVPAGVNGSSMASAANIGFGTWDTTGTLYATSVLKVDSALSALVTAGYSPVMKGVLWSQGETDADGINASTISQATYSVAFGKLIRNYRQEFGSGITFNISRTGFRVSASTTGYLQVQAAQLFNATPDSLINITYWNAYYYIQRSLMVDDYHYDQTAYNEMGRSMAENYVNSTGLSWQKQLYNVYMPANKVGIGEIIPQSPLHIYKTGTAREIYLYDSLNDAVRIDIANAQNSGFSGAALRLHNNNGLGAQFALLSSGSSLESNGLWIFNSLGGTLIGSDVGTFNIYAGGTATINNSKFRIPFAGNVGIGNNIIPDASAQLDVQSTTRGMRVPTMTGAQMNAIGTPANGLFIYNTDSLKHCFYNGTAWTCYGTGSGSSVNIYNSNGSLTGNRTLDLNNFSLTFQGDAPGPGVSFDLNAAVGGFQVLADTVDIEGTNIMNVESGDISTNATQLLMRPQSSTYYSTDASGTGQLAGWETSTTATSEVRLIASELLFENIISVSDTIRLIGNVSTVVSDTNIWKPVVINAQGALLTGSWFGSGGAGSTAWNDITNPTGTQALTFDDGEVSTWANGSNTEDLLIVTNNSLTTGTSFSWITNSLTTGRLLHLGSTSTALASGNQLLNLSMSGANATNAITATAIRSDVTNTNATSGTNIAAHFTASGATTANWALFTGSATAGAGRVNINNATNSANHTVIIRSINNTANEGLLITAQNETQSVAYSYQGLRGSSNITMSAAGAAHVLLQPGGGVGIGTGVAAPSAHLEISAGTTSRAPLEFNSGTNLTTPVNGSVEYDGTNYFATSGGTRFTIAKTLTNTATLDFGSTAAGTSTDLTITVTGAAVGQPVIVGADAASVPDNGVFFGWVSATNTVTVRYANNDLTNAKDPASGTFRVSVVAY